MKDVLQVARLLARRRLIWVLTFALLCYAIVYVGGSLADIQTGVASYGPAYAMEWVAAVQVLVLLALAALVGSEVAQAGMLKERHLAGQSMLRTLAVGALASIVVAFGVVFTCATVAAAVGVAYQSTRRFPATALSDVGLPFWPAFTHGLVGFAVAAVLCAALGTAIGAVSRRIVRASGIVIGLGFAMWLLRRASYTYPSLRWPAMLDVDGITSVARLGDTDPLVNVLHAGSWVVIPASVLWLVAAGSVCATVPLEPRHTTASDRRTDRDVSDKPTRYGFGARVLVVLVVCALVGAALPPALADALPWRLQPTWLLDEAQHRSSLDVTNRILVALRRGDVAGAAKLTEGGSPRRALSVFYDRLTGPGPALRASLPDTADSPGSVTVYRGDFSVIFCMDRGDAGWRLRTVTTLSCAGAS